VENKGTIMLCRDGQFFYSSEAKFKTRAILN
jgi:hypothetical protein